METVGIKQLAEEVGLDPKLVRRIIRKDVKRGPAESGKYEFNPESSFYTSAKEACERFKAKLDKEQARKPKSESAPPSHSDDVKMDDRGFSITDGYVWAIGIGEPDKKGVSQVKTCCLGRKEQVIPYIEGRTKMKPVFDDPIANNALLSIMTGAGAILPPPPEARNAPKRDKTKRRGLNRRRR